MRKSAGQYAQLVAYRVAVVVLALLMGIWALHERGSGAPVWLLSSILAVAASAALVWPLVVPAPDRTMNAYTIAPAFFMAGMFLVPPRALVGIIAFSVALAGLLRGDRAYRTVFRLSSMALVFVGFATWFRLSPQASDYLFRPAPRAALELAIAAAAFTALLIVRSIELRLEQGAEHTPHWGAFQKPAIVEAMLCLAFSTTTIVLARVHTGFLLVVGFQMAMIWWFLHRYAAYTAGLARVTDRRRKSRATLWDSATRAARRASSGAAAPSALRRVEPRATVEDERGDDWSERAGGAR